MGRNIDWGTIPLKLADYRDAGAEDIVWSWVLQLPAAVDPTEVARNVLADAPQRIDDSPLQQRLRTLLVMLSQSSTPESSGSGPQQ